MSENYFYSSLSAQEIEDTLVGAVVYNSDQALTTSQKAQARANIGAGENDTKVIIMGFFDTLADLQSQIPVGAAGDVYAVGTQSPYDIYIWDATHTEWKDNGPLSFSDAIIDDGDISLSSTWSSQKINTQLAGKQAAISAVGMLKGTGTAVQAATLGSDYTAVDDTLSSSTTKTWSITKIGQAIAAAIAGLVSFAAAQTLTDAQKAQARTNIGAAKGWELVWTNQSPTAAFAAQTIQLGGTFTEVKIVFVLNNGTSIRGNPFSINADGETWRIYSNSNNFQYARNLSCDGSALTVDGATKYVTYGSYQTTADNTAIIPLYIYGR